MKQKINLVLSILFLVSGLNAQAKSIDIKNEAFVEKEEKAKDGKIIKKLVPATTVVPGSEVIFVITYKNIGKEAATDVVVTNPIPKNMTYKAAESEKEAVTELSVDGGKVYSELSKLKVMDKLRKQRPALPEDVTHVRWKVTGSIPPNQEGKVKLKAILK